MNNQIKGRTIWETYLAAVGILVIAAGLDSRIQSVPNHHTK
jgi:hypothetical protein